MASKKKAARKKTAPKKSAPKNAALKKSNTSGKRNSKGASSIKIIVEGVVVLRLEGLSVQSLAGGLLGGGSNSNFSYVFDLQGCGVTNFVVGHYISENPANSGSFYSPVMDPSIPPEIHVVVIAAQNLPGCTGTLALKYLGKDVFASPKPIVFSGGMGSINEKVKLPL